MFWNVIKEHEVSLAKKSDRSLNKLLVKIEKVARTRTCDEDSIQKILISVFKSIDKFDQNKGDFNHWLSRLITNQLRKDYNKNNSDPHLFLRFEYDNEENEDLRLIVNQPEIKEEQKLRSDDYIISLLKFLKPKQREVFILYEINGLSHGEISDLLSVDENTSKSNLSRGKKNLRRLWKEKKS
jgi:RNA polymerase sigma factor (sigma-70 family)